MMLIVLLYTCVLFVANTSPGIAQDIRLVGRIVNNEGRVEVFRSGQWQTICDEGWDLNDADVACRQLGYGYAIRVLLGAAFGEGTGGQWEATFSCTGSESRLEDCFTSSVPCSHDEDVGVICSTSSLQQGSLRLVSSSTTYFYVGRLEIYVSGQWGTVCDDFWGNNEAIVACKQMGFEGAYDSNWTLSSSGSSSQTIWLDDVTCTGIESQLISCSHRGLGVEDCRHSEDIGIRCTRLVTSTLPPEPVTISPSTLPPESFTVTISTSTTSYSSHTTSSVSGIITGVVIAVVFLCVVPCVIICIVVVICAQQKRRTTRVVRAPATTTAGAVAMVNQQPQQQQVVYQTQPNNQQQQGGYTPQPDYQQQQEVYPSQPDYQQQQGGYPPQPDYQQQRGGYPPQSDYQQQQGGYPPQPDYQQQQGGYPPQPDYQQQQGGYPPQPDYQQQQGGYPPQPDYQQQGDSSGQQPTPVPSCPQPTDPIEDNPPPYPY